MGITSGAVKKRPEGTSEKMCGLFAKDWPEWLTLESAFDVELSWVCVKEATFVASLVSLYQKKNFSHLGTGSRVTPGELHLLFTVGTPSDQ
jgi:hypothetical protein